MHSMMDPSLGGSLGTSRWLLRKESGAFSSTWRQNKHIAYYIPQTTNGSRSSLARGSPTDQTLHRISHRIAKVMMLSEGLVDQQWQWRQQLINQRERRELVVLIAGLMRPSVFRASPSTTAKCDDMPTIFATPPQ